MHLRTKPSCSHLVLLSNSTDPVHRIFGSDQITFHVGIEKSPVVVHAAAIGMQSKALHILMNGPLSEAQTKSVYVDDVLEEDFIRFCQFAYTRDYSIPSPTKDGHVQSKPEWS